MPKDVFSLEDLAKIQGVASSVEITTFFHVLDTYISDDEVEVYMQGHTHQSVLPPTCMRDDQDVGSDVSVQTAIIQNFPAQIQDLLIVPLVIA